MKLFYTNASVAEGPQIQGFNSIGGLLSSSEVENDTLNSLFGSISEYGKQQRKPEYRIIVIENDENFTYTGLKVWLEQLLLDESDILDTPFASFQVGFTEVQTDDCGNLFVQRLPTTFSKPYSVTMETVDGEDNAMSLPDIEQNMFLGIVISRTILPEASEALSDDEYLAILEGNLSLAQSETFDLKFSWD